VEFPGFKGHTFAILAPLAVMRSIPVLAHGALDSVFTARVVIRNSRSG
jgi:hypothetical protein